MLYVTSGRPGTGPTCQGTSPTRASLPPTINGRVPWLLVIPQESGAGNVGGAEVKKKHVMESLRSNIPMSIISYYIFRYFFKSQTLCKIHLEN